MENPFSKNENKKGPTNNTHNVHPSIINYIWLTLFELCLLIIAH